MKKKTCIVDIKIFFQKKYLRQPSIDFDFCKIINKKHCFFYLFLLSGIQAAILFTLRKK
jgi:hypothetical protein